MMGDGSMRMVRDNAGQLVDSGRFVDFGGPCKIKHKSQRRPNSLAKLEDDFFS